MTTIDAIQPDPENPVQAPKEEYTGTITDLPVEEHPESPLGLLNEDLGAEEGRRGDDDEAEDDTPDDGSERRR